MSLRAERIVKRIDAEHEDHLRSSLQGRSDEEVSSRIEAIDAWMERIAISRDNIVLTPLLVDHLTGEGEIANLLEELDALRDETGGGRFDGNDLLQRDLEFGRFVREFKKSVDKVNPTDDPYGLFEDLQTLPDSNDAEVELTDEHLLEVKRVAHEAVGFLEFVREFKTTTSRPIVIVGNDKAQVAGGGYGRQWVVEPLEEYLTGDFEVVYNRVPSHGSMRLVVPAAFPKDSVRKFSGEMPHLVIVDGASSSRVTGLVRFSKAIRGYANWFALFNELRSDGGGREPGSSVPLPDDHVRELRRWHEYEIVKGQIEGWVDTGPPYEMRLWGPGRTDDVMLGEVQTRWPAGEVGGDNPLVVFANPIRYLTEGGDSSAEWLTQTKPYFLDSADRVLHAALDEHVASQGGGLTHWGGVDDNPVGPSGALNPALTLFGFGPYGFERRVVGPTTEGFVRQIQRHIKADIEGLLTA